MFVLSLNGTVNTIMDQEGQVDATLPMALKSSDGAEDKEEGAAGTGGRRGPGRLREQT